MGAVFCASLFALASGCTGSVKDPVPLDPSRQLGRCVRGVPHTSRFPRLSHAQYDNTIQDLLHLAGATPSSMLPPDTAGPLDQRSFNGYQLAAETLASTAMASSRDQIVPCTPSGDGSACAREVIVSFGRRAFRRPLTEEEIGRFTALYAQRGDLTENGSFDAGIQLVIEAFLQSPSFLMLPETSTNASGNIVPLSSHEVATRLAYTLWNSMPDDALLDAADQGRLTTPDEIRAQAERMLDHPRARVMVARFNRQWLGIEGNHGDRWTDINRAEDLFPSFDPASIPALTDESLRFLEHVVFEENGTFASILTDGTAFVNRRTAAHYDLDPASYGDELVAVELDPTRRPGIFTRLGFLTSNAMVDRTSPILRGAFLQKEILCAELGNPPPGAEMTELPQPGPGVITTRDRVSVQTSPTECAGCHRNVINPAGFAFENYDAVGAWRDLDNGEPVNAGGEAPFGTEIVEYEGPADFLEQLARSPAAHACYARHWVEFAYARSWTDQDRCVVQDLSPRLAEDGYTIRDLLVDLTLTESFRSRALEATQ